MRSINIKFASLWYDFFGSMPKIAVPANNTQYCTTCVDVLGLLVGVLQLFIVLTVGDTLGGSSSYVTLVSQWVVTRRLQGWFPYLARARCGMGNWWQVSTVVCNS